MVFQVQVAPVWVFSFPVSVFKATKTTIWTAVFHVPRLSLGEETVSFQLWEVANHWNGTMQKVHEKTRFPSKPHWQDLVFTGESKIKLPQASLVPTGALNWNSSTRHTATSSDVNIKKRDSENGATQIFGESSEASRDRLVSLCQNALSGL